MLVSMFFLVASFNITYRPIYRYPVPLTAVNTDPVSTQLPYRMKINMEFKLAEEIFSGIKYSLILKIGITPIYGIIENFSQNLNYTELNLANLPLAKLNSNQYFLPVGYTETNMPTRLPGLELN